MTDFRVEPFQLDVEGIDVWGAIHPQHRNWPVVYVMNNEREVYVGESSNAYERMKQHLKSEEKQRLTGVRVILDDTFNKSVCWLFAVECG